MKQKKSLKFKILTGLAIFLIVVVSGFFIYVNIYYKASSQALESLNSDSEVRVEEDKDIAFEPVSNEKNIGFILYPGAKVEPQAYAPLAKEIASNGYTTIIAEMNFNLAILSPNRAENITNEYTDIDTWVIGGHSLGGVMATNYAQEHDDITGLVLLASYPQDNVMFTDDSIEVLSLWGSNDQVANLDKVKDAKNLLPKDAEFKEIEGGNHGGFGDYGHQKGDGEATLTNQEQMMQTAQYIVEFMNDLQAE
jgi:hypothetical protein